MIFWLEVGRVDFGWLFGDFGLSFSVWRLDKAVAGVE